ncbi:MAG: hypothetical protein ACYCW6_01270 [Candidatus Xenobia bacterium]
MEVREVGPNTPLCGVIRKVLESSKQSISCDELAVAVREYWGRSFPQNPYEDACLIFKLAGTYLDVAYNYEDLGGEVPLVRRREHGDGQELTPRMSFADLNRAADEIKRVKLSLK